MSLKAWYPFNGNHDNYGVGNLSLTQTTTPTYTDPGKLGEYALLNGAFKWTAAQTASVLNNQSITIAFWIKVLNSNSSSTLLFGDNSRRHYALFNYPSMNDFHYSWRKDAGEGTWTSGDSVIYGAFPTNVWTHCCVVYNNPKGYIYINGVLKREFSGVNPTSSFAYETQVIHHNPNRYLQDYRVYDHALTPREVRQLAQGLVLHYPMNNNNHTNILTQAYNFKNSATGFDEVYGFPTKSVDNSTGTGSTDFQSWSNIITASKGAVYTLSFYARSSNSTGLTTFLYNNSAGVQISNIVASSQGTNGSSSDGNCRFRLTPQWQYCWVTYTFNGSRDGSSANLNKHLLFRALAGDKAEIAAPKLEMGSVATPFGLNPSEISNSLQELDSSGYNHHGTRSASFTYISNKDTRYSNSTAFSTGTQIRCNNFSTTGWKDITMAAWVRPRNTANGEDINTIIIGGTYLAIRTSNNCATTYCYGMNPAGYHTGKTALPLNTWSHIAAVWDSANSVHKIYVNGKEDFSISCSGTASNGGKKDFGSEGDDKIRPYNGDMADARIYATALSAEDIKILYESAAALFNNGSMQAYEFNEHPSISKISYRKTGAVKAEDFSEIGYIGGMKTKILPDGSAWARIHWLDLKTTKTVFANNDEVAFCDLPNRFSKMGLVEHFKSTGLPEEYTLLEYIQSSGSQYIDTGHHWISEATKIEVDMTVVTDGTYRSMFGNEEYIDTGNTRYFAGIPHGSGTAYSIYLGTSAVTTFPVTVGTRFKIGIETTSAKQYTITKNGSQVATGTYSGSVQTKSNANITSTASTNVGNIFLFANHNSQRGSNNGPTQNMAAMRLYGCKMYENGYIVRDFVPCKNESGTVGLYDRHTKKFYTTPTGTFTAGSTLSGHYEFMLTYPTLSATAYNRWSQTSSPNAAYGSATGLTKITTAWSNYSGAITKSNSSGSALYSMNEAGNWWAPIGQKTLYNSTGIPAANGSTQTETELWIRIDQLPNLKKISMLDENHIQAFDIKEL